MKNAKNVIEIDDLVTRVILGYDHVLDYYHEFSCDHLLEEVNIPSLFISNKEDPVCY